MRFLEEMGIIDLERDSIHDIGLIFSGSVPQPIHFDIAKVKANKDCYEEVMGLPNSPAVILLGFSGPIQIGVEKSQAEMVSSDESFYPKCKIKGGVPGEEFVVVGEVEQLSIKMGKEYTDEMYILKSEGGFMFKGDFLHAGYPAATVDQDVEMQAWKSVNEILMDFSANPYLWDKKYGQTDVFERLLAVPNLDTIARLHCMVKPRDKEFIIESAGIGFDIDE